MASASIRTLADLMKRVGVPPDRIRFSPAPGTATVEDVAQISKREGVLCELVEGVLLEKAMGWNESCLAGILLGALNAFVIPRNLGVVAGADGTIELMPDLVRIPDVAFTNWSRFPGQRRPTVPVPALVPNLVVEVLSESNAHAEMVAKRHDYFTAGVELVWEIDPATRQIAVYTSVDTVSILQTTQTLDGGTVLPGFALPLSQLFGELDRHG